MTKLGAQQVRLDAKLAAEASRAQVKINKAKEKAERMKAKEQATQAKVATNAERRRIKKRDYKRDKAKRERQARIQEDDTKRLTFPSLETILESPAGVFLDVVPYISRI